MERKQDSQRLLELSFGDEVELFPVNIIEQRTLLVRQHRTLHCFRMENGTNQPTWKLLWSRENFLDSGAGHKLLITNAGWLLIRTRNGMKFYRLEGKDLTPRHYTTDGRYRSMYGWDMPGTVVLMGHFYADQERVGVLSRNKRGTVRFEQMVESVVLDGGIQPLWALSESHVPVPASWKQSTTHLSLALADNSRQMVIVERAAPGLINVHKFNENVKLQTIAHSEGVAYSGPDQEVIAFGNIFSGGDGMDLIQLSSAGLTLFQRTGTSFRAVFRNYPLGSTTSVWEMKHWRTAVLMDVDADGKDELWLSGPQGIVGFRLSDAGAQNMADDFEFPDDVRYARTMALLLDGLNAPILLSASGRSLNSFRLQPSAVNQTQIPEPNNGGLNTGEMEVLQPLFTINLHSGPRTQLSLAEQLDTSLLADPINPFLGNLNFALPLLKVGDLFSLSTTKYVFYQETDSDGPMGRGWSLSADCVFIDRRNSIFSEDHRYYLLRSGSATELTPRENNALTFDLAGSPDTSVSFNRTLNQWVIVNEQQDVFTYGSHGTNQFVKMDIGSENWPFPLDVEKYSDRKDTHMPSVWYLVHHSDRLGDQWLQYSYIKESGQDDLLLSTIATSSGGLLQLSYTKHFGKNLFTNFRITTPSYSQSVDLRYVQTDDQVRLHTISQQDKTVLQFTYRGVAGAMSEFVYPNGLVARFDYNPLQINRNVLMNSFETFAAPRAEYGPSYLLVCDVTAHHQLRVRLRDHLGSDTIPIAGSTLPMLGKRPVLNYEVFTGEKFFALLLNHGDEWQLELCLFHSEADVWQAIPTYIKLPKGTAVRRGQDFLLAIQAHRVTIIERTNGQWRALKPIEHSESTLLYFFTHGFLAYDDQVLKIHTRHSSTGAWLPKVLSNLPAGLIRSSSSVFDRFDHSAEVLDNLKRGLLPDALGMYHNVIVFRALTLEDTRLYVVLYLLHMNNEHQVVRQEVRRILIEDLATYTFNPPEMEGNTFQFGYRQEGAKYRLKVVKHTGKILEEMEKIKAQVEQEIRDQPRAPEAEKQRYRQEVNDKLNSQLNEIYQNITTQIPFAIDPGKLGMIINEGYILTASHKVQFDGVEWNETRIAQSEITLDQLSLPLGHDYRLTKAHHNATFQLQKIDGSVVFDTDTSDPDELHIRHPSYMAVQTNASTTTYFYHFDRAELMQLPANETLSRNSNAMAIISTTHDGKALLVRTLKSFSVTVQNVIWCYELLDSRKERKVTYHYDFDSRTAIPHGSDFLLTDVRITPVHRNAPFGWFQERYNVTDSTQSTKSVFNSAGKFVKVLDQSASSADAREEAPIDQDGALLARDGRTIIADVRPYRISQDLVSYYGFEPYERNVRGSDGQRRWAWSNGKTLEERGNHFLRLPKGSSLSGTFQPASPVGMLLVSCWLRTSGNLNNSLLVNQNGKTVKGEVRFTVEGWKYIEAFIDSKSRFDVKVSASANSHMDVDHLRVSPIHLKLEIQIYDHTTGLRRSTMYASGLLSHYLHDRYGKEIAHITEEGTLDSFTFRSRVHNTRIDMTPSQGELLKATKANAYAGVLKHQPDTVVLRFRYAGSDTGTVTIAFDTRIFLLTVANKEATLRQQQQSITGIPVEGELVIFCTGTRYSIWVEGKLISESFDTIIPLQNYRIESSKVHVWEAILLYDATVKVIYSSDFGLPRQLVELKGSNSVAVQEILYDELNRPAIKTKWTEVDCTDSPTLFAYRDNFVRNESHVWKSGQLSGRVAELNEDCEGYPFSRTVYAKIPLDDQKIIQSFPGKSFAIDGAFAKRFDTGSRIDFLENLFPKERGFRYEYERYPDQSVYVTVHDRVRKLKVAYYVRTHDGDHRLTTYQYDSQNRLITQLPPTYHDEADTFSRIEPFEDGSFSPEQLQLQHTWGTRYEYDPESGLLVSKRTPDSGTVQYLYTPEGLLRFVVWPNQQKVMYFTYSPVGELSEKGMIEMKADELTKYLANDATLPPSSNSVSFDHDLTDLAPQHRHHVQSSWMRVNNRTLAEILLFDQQEQLVSSTLFSNSNHSLSIAYTYRKNQIHELQYPIKVQDKGFRLRYTYDFRGKIASVANVATGETYVAIENNALGLPKTLTFQPASSYSYRRHFSYNQPGYLTKIEDPYLTETIDYTGRGYGGLPVGDGTVQMTHFNATWHNHSNARLLQLKATHFGPRRSKLCYEALKSSGYVDSRGRPTRSLYPALELRLPILCQLGTYGHRIAALLDSRGFPQLYGHRYDYGSHRQMIRAKYFQNEEEAKFEPLRSASFADIDGLDAAAATAIWSALNEAGFVHSDCRRHQATGLTGCHGLPGKSLFHPIIDQHSKGALLGGLLMVMINARKNLFEGDFQRICSAWYRDEIVDPSASSCTTLWSLLLNNNFVGINSNHSVEALNPELRTLLKPYSDHLPAIVGLLFRKFSTALGHSSGDVQSYGIDGNGNHRHFYTGFRRYRFDYVEGTNKIAAVYRMNLTADNGLQEERLPMEHNEEGSVTRALHKGIQRITYDPLLNRPAEIAMTDGRRILFDYNVRGQRLSKRCYDRSGTLTRKKYYVRDVHGKPLIEYEAMYDGLKSAPQVRATIFIYADDRLIGFMRNDQFYSVSLDHEGSVRLVVRNGEVVAAYDYLPYGELLRSYGEDPDGQLDYRFTGKEWDDETGLYDFHARLYDPELGRFYQMDPKEQYASPYVYAGNSPISLVDPDGQFAFIIAVVVFATAGAYLGAASANNSWDPTKWTLKKALLGGVIGGLVGGFAPAGFVGSFAVLSGAFGSIAATGILATSTVGFAYLNIAAANGNWDPSKWDWSKPGTWDALFTGAITGGGLFNTLGNVRNVYSSLSGMHRAGFVLLTGGVSGGILLYSGSRANNGSLMFWEWDWSKPTTVWGAVQGANFGLQISPQLAVNVPEIVQRFDKVKEIFKAIKAKDFKVATALVKDEVKAWRSIYSSISGNDLVQHGVSPDLMLKAKAYMQMHGKEELMGVIENILAGQSILFKIIGKDERERRSITFAPLTISNESYLSPSYLSYGKLIHETSSTKVPLMISSSSKVSSWINNLFQGIFRVPNLFQQYSFNESNNNVQLFKTIKQDEQSKFFHVSNCFYQPSDRTGSNKSTCYENHGVSYIFTYNQIDTQPITEDSFSICYPIEYEGLPSVACPGTNITYVFTPYRTHINYLDHLNGTLTLLMVLPTIASSFTAFVKNLVNGTTVSSSKPSDEVSKDEVLQLIEQLDSVRKAVEEYRMVGAGGSENWRWVENIMADIDEDIRSFVSGNVASRDEYEELQQRIVALNEELVESAEIMLLQSNNEGPIQSAQILSKLPAINAEYIDTAATRHISVDKFVSSYNLLQTSF
ncbi:uncharacterized protein LOC126573180 [Anopheles aquasalis]|uniref:uncharacterized protein LOC126573180 n=1 Tax=Anopheles aquasalis TaxID=42839 RepID=UPI00215ADFA5|nr:uncharacterized protein LOC126573180 [Anopheles aquasalis]